MSLAETAATETARQAMPLVKTLQVLVDLRQQDQIVTTSMGSAREWPKLSDHPLDFHYIPSTMGGGPPLGLGFALAQPAREVMVICGDGSLLMNLGCLVTIIGSGATNLSIVLIDNGVYEITGGQKTAAIPGKTDFAMMARAAGFTSVGRFSQLDQWQQAAKEFLQQPGPRFVWLEVEPVREDYFLDPPGPLHERLEMFRQALAA